MSPVAAGLQHASPGAIPDAIPGAIPDATPEVDARALDAAAQALVRAGYRSAREVARVHARSFYFASHLLFGARRRAAYALYAFCRRLDDLVDEGQVDQLPQRLERARQMVAEAYLTQPQLASRALESPAQRLMTAELQSSWHPGELRALEDAIARFAIPEQPFQDLISGMEMDLVQTRYRTTAQLDLYCYRVAGVVGLMMAPLLDCADPAALPHAVDLGRAMQLTNILRDVREDLLRGRCYLPEDELAAFGLCRADLGAQQVDGRWRAFMAWQVARARALYASAERGVPALRAFGAQRMVRLMGAIYGDILRQIERRDFDVFSGRARVGGGRKLLLASAVMLTPLRPAPAAPIPALPSSAPPSPAGPASALRSLESTP